MIIKKSKHPIQKCECVKYVGYATLDGNGGVIEYLPGEIYNFWTENNKAWGKTYFVKCGESKMAFSNLVNDSRSFNKLFKII